jgi:hypothetical protein
MDSRIASGNSGFAVIESSRIQAADAWAKALAKGRVSIFRQRSITRRKFDPSKIKSGKTVYQIAGTGAVILDRQ